MQLVVKEYLPLVFLRFIVLSSYKLVYKLFLTTNYIWGSCITSCQWWELTLHFYNWETVLSLSDLLCVLGIQRTVRFHRLCILALLNWERMWCGETRYESRSWRRLWWKYTGPPLPSIILTSLHSINNMLLFFVCVFQKASFLCVCVREKFRDLCLCEPTEMPVQDLCGNQ